MEDGLEKLLPVVATFLQFSPGEMARIKEARAKAGDGGGGGGSSLFSVFGEDWLFGEQKAHQSRRASRTPRSGGQGQAQEQQGDAWHGLEQSYKKEQRLKKLLFTSQAQVEQLRDALAVLQARLVDCNADASLPVPDRSPQLRAPPLSDVRQPLRVATPATVAPPTGADDPPAAARTTRPADDAPMTRQSSGGADGGGADDGGDDEDLADAEEAAERALERELVADAEARAQLEAALASGRPEELRQAVEAMAARGIDGEDAI
eukprot:6706987-Prymnesium_polylepis.1